MGLTDEYYDVAVFGGGLAGFAAGRVCARVGLKTLIVERRPLLGWESTWALQLDARGGESETSATILAAVQHANGLRGQRLDAPILEMVLDRDARASGLCILYYSQAVDIIADGAGVLAVVVGNKSGEMSLRATAFVDATENGLLWKLAGGKTGAEEGPAQFAIILNGLPEPVLPGELGVLDGLTNVTLKPGIWPGEAIIYFEIPSVDIRAAYHALPGLLRELRGTYLRGTDALVTQVGVEPFPLRSPRALEEDGRHPRMSNLFAVNFGESPNTQNKGVVVERLDWGERVGKKLAQVLPSLQQRPGFAPKPQSIVAPPIYSSQVLVCGGGTAGALAAIAAGRQGAETTLLEASTFLGGIGSGGGIHMYYLGEPGGLQDELDERVKEMMPLFGPPRRVTGFHPDVKKVVLQQMAEEARVNVVLETTVTGVVTEDLSSTLPARGTERCHRRIIGVVAAGPQGNTTHRASVVVDSTGDGDVAFMAGAPFTMGRATDGLTHAYSQGAGRLDENGKLLIINFDAGYCDSSDVEDLTRARRHGLGHYWQDSFTPYNHLVYIAPHLGIRSSRQILGQYRLTLSDEIAHREFSDVIAYGRSHYDNHAYDYENESDEAMLWVWLLGNWAKPIGSDVPYRCLLPLEVEGLIVACRALSVTPDAHHQLRMQRDMQRIGEAAGIAAALCAAKGVLPSKLRASEIQSKLLESGALKPRKAFAPPSVAGPDVRNAGNLTNGPARPLELWMEDLGGNQPAEAVLQVIQTGEAALPFLTQAAMNGEENRSFLASVALAMLGKREAVPALIACVRERHNRASEGKEAAPRWFAALVLLGRTGDSRALPAIVDVIEDHSVGLDCLIAAVRALGRIGDVNAVPHIERMLVRSDLPVTRKLRKNMGPSPDVTEDARWQLELASVGTLAHLGAVRQDLVLPYLHDPRAYVRRYARQVNELVERKVAKSRLTS